MFGIENYTGFIVAAIILNLTPGVDTFYVLDPVRGPGTDRRTCFGGRYYHRLCGACAVYGLWVIRNSVHLGHGLSPGQVGRGALSDLPGHKNPSGQVIGV